MYRFRDGAVSKLVSAALDGSVNGYIQAKLGKIAPDRFGVVADAAIGSNSSTSTMLAWIDGKLIQVYPPRSSGDENVQTNANAVLSGDGNDDGILDIHALTEAPGQSDGVAYSDLLWIEDYKQWNGIDHFDLVGRRYTDPDGTYAIDLPLSWTGFTFRHPPEGGVSDIALDAYNEETGSREEQLAVRVVPLGGWNAEEGKLQEADSRYLELGRSDGLVYYAVWKNKLTAVGNKQKPRRYFSA